MRVFSLLVVLSVLSVVCAQEGEGKKDNPPQEQRKIPTDIAEAHAELERILSAEVLSEIDAMPSEGDMVRYQTGSGLSIGNGWGLWRGGLLAQRLQEWGFTDPHDASSLILETFWCKRHGQALRLEERFRGKAMEIQERRKRRVEQAKAMIPGLMMGLRFEKRAVPVVEIPARSGMGVCFMCPFRDGVFLAVHCRGRIEAALFDRHMPPIRLYDGAFLTVDPRGRVEVSPFGKPIPPILPDEMDRRYADPPDGEIRRWVYYDESIVRGFYFLPGDREPRRAKPGDEFYTQGFYLDPTGRTIRRIRVAEVDQMYAAVVAGGRAWFAGLTNGRAVLVGVGDRDRITVPLPWPDEIPDLGMDDQSPLAVYSKAIYRLTDGTWTSLYFGDTLLPRSVPPPQRHGNMVLLRDRDWYQTHKHLWWFTLGEPWKLSSLDRDVGVLEAWGPPYWGEVLSYCITSRDDLWACVGGWNAGSLVRRSKDGQYAIALLKGCVRFPEDLPGSNRKDQQVSVSAVTVLPDDTLLLAGRTGLYRLKDNELAQELAFTAPPISDRIDYFGAISARPYGDSFGTGAHQRDWTPSHILALNSRSYVIGTALWDGVYLLQKGDDGQWRCLALDSDKSDVGVAW